jgi:hypothetical protein
MPFSAATVYNHTVIPSGAAQIGHAVATQTSFGADVYQFTGTIGLTSPVILNGEISGSLSNVTVTAADPNLTVTDGTAHYLGFTNVPTDVYWPDSLLVFEVSGGGLTSPVVIVVAAEPGLLHPLGYTAQVDFANGIPPLGQRTPGEQAPCFAAGTHIVTPQGEVLVENLHIGDTVCTASGDHRRVRWIGHRHVRWRARSGQDLDQPVRVCAGAIATRQPLRDLLVSPGHRLFFDDVLIRAADLVNGLTILRENVEQLTYWHVELESHDILMSEGLPTESYCPANNRSAFDNAPAPYLRPVTDRDNDQQPCAPVVERGPRLAHVRSWLIARALHLGARMTHDPAIQLVADGAPLTPISVVDERFEYSVPEDTKNLRLVSRVGLAILNDPANIDPRPLGVMVKQMILDKAPVELADLRLNDGWHEPEDGSIRRWTIGDANVPIARNVVLHLERLSRYPLVPPAQSPSDAVLIKGVYAGTT